MRKRSTNLVFPTAESPNRMILMSAGGSVSTASAGSSTAFPSSAYRRSGGGGSRQTRREACCSERCASVSGWGERAWEEGKDKSWSGKAGCWGAICPAGCGRERVGLSRGRLLHRLLPSPSKASNYLLNTFFCPIYHAIYNLFLMTS